MTRAFTFVALLGALSISTLSLAAEHCTRSGLQKAVDQYIAAQTKGDPQLLARTSDAKYIENRKDAELGQGILSKPLKVDFHRSLLDTETCQSFTEVIVADPAHPYVLGVHIKMAGGKVSELDTLVTQKDDWLFSAKNDLKYSPSENWGVIPKADRDSRETLIAAANAYFDLFKDKSTQVPWGTPCNRLEGGLRTGKGQPDDSCNVGVPSGVDLVNRHFVVDPDIGAVVGLVTFGKNGLPDSHLFRVEHGKIRYVHTITVCSTPNCGFPLPKQLQEERAAASP
jgi:hypothetical protein